MTDGSESRRVLRSSVRRLRPAGSSLRLLAIGFEPASLLVVRWVLPTMERPTAFLYRAVGLDEGADSGHHGGFRPNPSGRSLEAKWFATSLDDAVAFGRVMQRELPPPRPFVLAAVELPKELLLSLYDIPWLDGIGPAYAVRMDQLPDVNRIGRISVDARVYEVEER